MVNIAPTGYEAVSFPVLCSLVVWVFVVSPDVQVAHRFEIRTQTLAQVYPLGVSEAAVKGGAKSRAAVARLMQCDSGVTEMKVEARVVQ